MLELLRAGARRLGTAGGTVLKITDRLWVGDSRDERTAKMDAVLNVAKDLRPTRGWPVVEYYHVGLVDGPGNRLSTYCAAVMVLSAMSDDDKHVLVCCHDGRSRSMAVAMMYLGMEWAAEWDGIVAQLSERFDDLPEPHEAHKAAFDRINFGALKSLEF